MAENKHRAIPVEIGGKFYQLRYDFNSIVELENQTGTSYPTSTFKGIRALIWAGLLHDKSQSLSLEEVGNMLTPYLKDRAQYAEINKAAIQAFNAMFPEPTAQDEELKNAPAPAGAGS
jgi:hypothetical protein